MGKKQQASQPKQPPPATGPDLPPFLRALSATSCSIAVHAKPGAKVANLVLGPSTVDVAIDAPAREGEANAGIVDFLAEVLGVKRRDVSLAVGSKSREKVLVVEGLDAQTALERLRQNAAA